MKNKQKNIEKKGILLEKRFIFLAILAGLLYYIAYYFRFPNSFAAAIGLVFLIALIKNLKTKKGISVLIYLMIFNAITMPLAIFSLKIYLAYQIIYSAFIIVLFCLMINGLRKLRKWAFYLTLFLFVISLLNSANLVISFIGEFLKLSMIIFITRNVISLAFMIISVFYILKSKQYFKS